MDPNSVNQIVNNLADKIGVAVEKMQPLAEEVVRQYTARCGTMFFATLFCALLSALMLSACLIHLRRCDDRCQVDGLEVASCAGMLVFGVLSFGFIMSALAYLSAWVSPIPSLLGL